MKKNMLLILFMLFFVSCETGTRYDKNATRQTAPQLQSGVVERDEIEDLIDDDGEVFGTPSYVDRNLDDKDSVMTELGENESEVNENVDTYSSGVITDGLNVRQIREGKHEGYIRLVFDVYNGSKPAAEVGHYEAKHSNSKKDIVVVLQGYRKFTAPLPSFPYYSVVEQIHFDQYPDDSGFKFHIKLRKNATVKIFDLKSPARIVFDIKAI